MLIVLIVFFALLVVLHVKNVSFNIRVILAMICGVFIGIGYNYFEYSNDTFIQFGDILGDGYIALLKMLIIPIVLVSIIHSIVNLKNHTESYIIKVNLTGIKRKKNA